MRFFSFIYNFKIYLLSKSIHITYDIQKKRPTIFKNTNYYKFHKKMLVNTFLYFLIYLDWTKKKSEIRNGKRNG